MANVINNQMLYDSIVECMARIETMMRENHVQVYQQERLERWIFQLADQAGVKLKYEA